MRTQPQAQTQRVPAAPQTQQTVPDSKTNPPATAVAAAFKERRLALVIGNSNYVKLPKLPNPTNDARSIAQVLQTMGYQTQLLLDATEDGIRNAIRKFASDLVTADVALVYYAGHGAQLNGSNYLLPIDIDIPRTAADIQFSGLKLDDLVNSIGSNTKIVFLDACRDNPVLFKNIVAGRGSSPIGLAPASASNFAEAKPGGGVFIAYATDAGAVADDGQGKHSPFTQALLRYMQKPMSIDDMFSYVTREVRLVTKNEQRPYKYASLESIICLTPSCSSLPTAVTTDVVQQAQQSEFDELQIALQSNSVDALESYLQKYPDITNRDKVLNEIATLKRSQMTEWTLFEIADGHLPWFMQLSSIKNLGDRAAVRMKYLVDKSKPKTFYGRTLPDAAYVEELNVYDCTKPRMATADDLIFDKSGNLLFHYKWADPEYLNLAVGVDLEPKSIGSVTATIVCSPEVGTPLVSKDQISSMKFASLSSMTDGSGELFYAPADKGASAPNEKALLFILRNFQDRNLQSVLPPNVSVPNAPNYRVEVDHVLIKCDENKYAIDKVENWNSSNELVRIGVNDSSVAVTFSSFQDISAFATLQQIYCGKPYSGLGMLLTTENGAVKVAEVFSGSPAEVSGVKAEDVITQIDHELVAGLPLEKVIEKSRGPSNSSVTLTIKRGGASAALDISVVRANVQMLPGTPGKSK